MSLTSMHYADNLEDKLAGKRSLGHYANEPMQSRDGYQADEGWDELFTDYLEARSARTQLAEQALKGSVTVKETVIRRAGATVLEITSLMHRRRGKAKDPGKEPRP